MSFSQQAYDNINKLLKLLKTRLNSTGKIKSIDSFGNEIYIDCDIFCTDQLTDYLILSLSWFNQTPVFTSFSFEDTVFVEIFSEIIVTGATIQALAAKSLIEKGREFAVTDDGVTLNPPNVADLMHTQFALLLDYHVLRLKEIKKDIVSFFNKS
jgi:hypothetical protein